MGDYAGDELFLIEGDSLLAHTFSNKKLDFNPGFQLLHATYIIENFLRGIHQRKCTFHLVFFEDNAKLCIPPNIPGNLHSRYLLARESIIQHFQSNMDGRTSRTKVKVFDSYYASDFKSFLTASRAYFIMCHDGAFVNIEPGVECSASPESEDGQESDYSFEEVESAVPINLASHAIGFRSMINWFVCLGYSIALLNGLECRDTKVRSISLRSHSHQLPGYERTDMDRGAGNGDNCDRQRNRGSKGVPIHVHC